jgi:hypothetical protein
VRPRPVLFQNARGFRSRDDIDGIRGRGRVMIDLLNQPGIVPAIIGLLGAAIIVPLVKKFYFDVQNRLRVEVRPWNYKISEALKTTVRSSLDASSIFDDSTRDLRFHSHMRDLIRFDGYMTVTITNIGKKKISGVSVTATDMLLDFILQIDDADQVIGMKKGISIDVGDIQPKHSRVIHIWSNADTSFKLGWFKHFLRISANELDAVRLRFPTPPYLRDEYATRILFVFGLLFLLFFVSPILYAAINR